MEQRGRLGFKRDAALLLLGLAASSCAEVVVHPDDSHPMVDGGGAGGAGGAASASGGAGTGGFGMVTSSSNSGAGGGCSPDVALPNVTLPDITDPESGNFTLDEALIDLPEGPGPLRAILETDVGTVTCELRPDKAQNGVANFVGLARGRRPWKDPVSKQWVKRRFYDGLLFHRVIPGFVAQGGDPLATGTGGPGYKISDEISNLSHVPGALAYANSGPNSSGSQFYITEVELTDLDGKYTVFGLCAPVSVVVALTHVATNVNDRPVKDLHMKTVSITRCAP
jgi:peptidyl-prolyl cis-trans isomerase A (cyclophilin A)